MLSKGLVFDQERTYVDPGAGPLLDRSRYGHAVTDTAITYTKLPRGLYVPVFDGATSKIALGDLGLNILSCIVWIYPDDNTTRSILDLDGGTISLELDAGGDLTATGWTAPTRYVNAVVANAVAQSAWSMIAVTTATAIDASAVTIGNEATWYDGMMSLFRLWNYVLTTSEIFAIYNAERSLFGV